MNLIEKYKLPSLIILSLLCGVVWRIEVEFHGWNGLKWISYFHYAIPIGFGLFLLWANSFFDLLISQRVLINLASIAFGILVYFGLLISLNYLFNGRFAFLMMMQTPKWKSSLYMNSIFILVPLIPVGTYFILRAFKIRKSWKSVLYGIMGMVLSIPISVILLELINHKGGQDCIHSIKSGFIIPLWVISIGLIIIGEKKQTQIQE